MVFSFHASSSAWITANKFHVLVSPTPCSSTLWQFVSKVCTGAGIMDQQKWLDKTKLLRLLFFSLCCGRSFTLMENRSNGLPQDNSISHWCVEVLLKQADPFSARAGSFASLIMSARSVNKQRHHPCERESYANKKPWCGCSATKGGIFFLSRIADFVWVALINYTSKRNLLARITVFPA